MKFRKIMMYDTECIVYLCSADARPELHHASKMRFLCENSHRPTNFFSQRSLSDRFDWIRNIPLRWGSNGYQNQLK